MKKLKKRKIGKMENNKKHGKMKKMRKTKKIVREQNIQKSSFFTL